MRKTHWTGGAFWAVSILFPLLAAATPAGEPPVRRNPALPNPDDLISFDTTGPALPLTQSEADAHQRAFPLHYGSVPPPTAIRTTPGQPVQPAQTFQPAAPLGPAQPYPGTAVAAAGGEGFVDYREYLNRQDGENVPATPLTATAPEREPAAPPARPETRLAGAADDMPIPLPPPAEVVAMAAAESGRGGAEATPAARREFEPPPVLGTLTPPPLPELAGGAGNDNVTEARRPVTIDEMREEFDSLRAYCEDDSLGSAAEIYARMPDFGADEDINRMRADAANLLILGLARTGNLLAARRIYDSVPTDMPGFDARLAKARAVINLSTYYIRADRFADAFAVLMDVGRIENRSALNNELFRLMARMIPYLDNAEETDKALQIYNLLLGEVKSPGTAALFAENVRASVLGYYFHYVDKSDSPVHRRKRLDFLEHVFNSLESLSGNEDIKALQRYLGTALMERYAGDPDRAAMFYVEG